MKLEIIVDGARREMEVSDAFSAHSLNQGPVAFRLDCAQHVADVREVEPGVYSVLIEGRSYEVKIEPGDEGVRAGVNGRRYAVRVKDPRRLSRVRAALGSEGRQKVSAPMPGKVVRVVVREGQEVQAGDGMLVVEAMKMQNEIRSPKAGRVAAIHVAEGAAVAPGDILAEVE